MTAAAAVTLVLVGILVAALAATLIIVLVTLRGISTALAGVLGGVRTIADRTGPLGEVLGDIARDIDAAADVSEALLTDGERHPSEASS